MNINFINTMRRMSGKSIKQKFKWHEKRLLILQILLILSLVVHPNAPIDKGKKSRNWQIKIPQQLQNPNFKFILLKEKDKKPLESRWQIENNYKFDDPKLLDHIKKGGNYGIIGGFGDLIPIDADRPEIKEALEIANLFDTFTVQSGKAEEPGYHYYYICKNYGAKEVLFGEKNCPECKEKNPPKSKECSKCNRKFKPEEENHLGEIQSERSYVVGPNCIHPSGNIYKVINDVPIKEVSPEQIRFALKKYRKSEQDRVKAEEDEIANKSNIDLSSLLIENMIITGKFTRRGNEYQGSHPVHGSSTSMNFSVNTTRNVWHCFRCNSGGGPLLWIAVQEGIIDCSDCVPGILRNDKFKKVLKIAKEKYGLKEKYQEKVEMRTDSNEYEVATFKRGKADIKTIFRNEVDGIKKIEIDTNYNEIISKITLTSTQIKLKNVYSVDGATIFEVENAEQNVKGALQDIIKHIQSEGECVNRYDLQDGLSAILTAQGTKRERIITHSGCGIYQDDNKIIECINNAIPLSDSQMKQHASITSVWNKKVDKKRVKEILESYVSIISYYRPYEILPNMGGGAISPLCYTLKGTKRIDFVPLIFNVGTHGLGKTCVTELVTNRLWGTAIETGKGIDSDFRLEETLDSTTFPVRVGECEKVRFNDYMATLKNSTERQFLSSRGRGDLTKQMYYSRTQFFFDSNSLTLSDPNLLPRAIIINFDSTQKEIREQNKIKFESIYKKIRPIGKYFWNVIKDLFKSDDENSLDWIIEIIEKVADKIRKSDIILEDARRAEAWGIVYAGLFFWEIVFREYGIKWSMDVDKFIEEVVRPIEKQSTDELTSTSPIQFRSWLEHYIRIDLTRVSGDKTTELGRGDLWLEDKNGYWITNPILQKYNEHAAKTHDISFQNMRHLGREIASVFHLPVENLNIVKKFGDKSKRAVFVPLRETPNIDGYGNEKEPSTTITELEDEENNEEHLYSYQLMKLPEDKKIRLWIINYSKTHQDIQHDDSEKDTLTKFPKANTIEIRNLFHFLQKIREFREKEPKGIDIDV